MLATIINIARLHLRLTFNRPSIFVSYILMPILFTFLIGQALADDGNAEPVILSVKVANHDNGELGAALIERLATEPALSVQEVDQQAGVAAVEGSEAVALLIIPADFSQSLATGITLDFYVDPAAIAQARTVERIVLAKAGELGGALATASFSAGVAERLGLFDAGVDRDAYLAEGIDLALAAWQSPPVSVSAQAETPLATPEDAIPTGVNQSSPGMLVMFAMFLMLGGAAVLLFEREMGTLRRLLVAPISRVSILLGKTLGIYLSGVFQVAILIVASLLLFDVQWDRSPLALALMVLSFAFAVTGLSMAMAAWARTAAQVNSLNTLIVLSVAALGGAWWPLEIVPSWMQTVGHLTPVAWAMDGFHDIITRGLDVTAVLAEVGILLGFGFVFLLLGLLRFRYEQA
ncbi:MAG: ABC transporter permease [Chloroflexi bacterium]|nr:ABC transporter permease [Chloroflexota bacterium]MCI0645836.1 ABC transporter permease [Chloroflexota bacterium]MCI0725691.1 ABC transporter permease [Chloroflexota bacterium]